MDEELLNDTDGLSLASTEDLRQLAAAVATKQVGLPLTASSLAYSGFGHLTPMMTPFLGAAPEVVLGVLRAVLAERRRVAERQLDLVWSGSDSGPSYARYTKIVVPELIDRANHRVTIAGYSFDEGTSVFSALRQAMYGRHVGVRMFLDIDQLSKRLEQQLWKEKRASRLDPLKQARTASADAFAREVLTLFREVHWPYEEPAPALYFDPRTADKHIFASLHAKCLIVDEEHVLITSANFTGRGQDRNIEVGIVVHDKGYAVALERQWNNLIESGDVQLG
jgi:phosphatidylserine/phosphatidylglycerophosphate/cardiolipin synthase-like enzyme